MLGVSAGKEANGMIISMDTGLRQPLEVTPTCSALALARESPFCNLRWPHRDVVLAGATLDLPKGSDSSRSECWDTRCWKGMRTWGTRLGEAVCSPP